MQKIEIKPLVGIVIQNTGEVLLGQHRNNVYNLLGAPTRDDQDSAFYDDLEVRFDFDQHETLEFIEFIYGPTTRNVELSIYNVNPFAVGADKLLKILSLHNQGDIDAFEAPYCYCFLNTSVGVWRDLIPEDVKGDNTLDDLKKTQNFWTIGIGTPNYYLL